MTENTSVSLNFQAPNISTVVYAVQNDRLSRQIVAQLRDGSAPWTPPTGSGAFIRYLKPDGTAGFYDADENNHPAITIDGSVVTLTLAEQAMTVPGDVYMQLNFYGTDVAKLTTFCWILRVQKSVLEDATIISSDYYNALTAKVSQAVQAASAAEESAAEAAASAALISIPLPITSGGTGATTAAGARTNLGLGNVANKDLSNVDNVRQYSANNQPPYPVRSVNGQTGDVTVQAATDAQVTNAVDTWLGNNITQETGYVLDASLTMSNAAPPASAVGAVREIADAVGMVFPYVVEAGGLDFHANSKPTVSTYQADRRAHTSLDFPLKLVRGTIITPNPYFRFIVMYTTDGGSTYTTSGWKTGAYTVPTDMDAYLTLASNKSGEPDVLSPETLAANYTITLPISARGLLGDVAALQNDYDKYKTAIGTPLTQYLNASEWSVNYYWNSSLTPTSSNGYECIKAEGLKAGTYHFNRLSAPFTWFENLATGEVKRASTDYGFSDITTETEVTIDYDFNLYLTITGSHLSYGVMVTDGDMPDSYLSTAQVYGFNLTNAFKASVKKPIYCGSTREYTTLKTAIEEATKSMDSVVYVDAETFDLVQEFGEDWLESYATEGNCGLFLKNRVHVIFASGAKVVFNYTGSNEYIQRRFSPFNAGEYGFTLENAYVESKNCRYSVHDERGTQTDPYHNIYKRCTFIHDSTGTAWGSHQAIGGGLGKNGDILIEDCYLITAGTATTVSYHNSAATDAESKVILKDSYLSSTSLISNYGTSAKKTRMIVTNCSLGFEPIVSTEAQYADNVELVKWNNNIRS